MINLLKTYFFCTFALVALSLVFSADSIAEDSTSNDPQWKKSCQSLNENQICQLSYGQNVVYGEQTVWVSRVGVATLNQVQSKLFVYGPLGVMIPDGVTYSIDGSPAVSMEYMACFNLLGCQATMEIDQTILNQIKNGNNIKIDFVKPNLEILTANVTLKGFTKALNGN
jgi:invasion protein IalB